MLNKNHSFFLDVWEVVRLVPHGRVTTYGAIAKYLGTGKSARMVGWAMNTCPPDVPAQRVVNRSGLLTGKHHFDPERPMELILKEEGIEVVDDQIINFEALLWDPKELDKNLD